MPGEELVASLFGSGMQSGGSIATSVINGLFRNHANKSNQRFALEQQRRQNAFNLEMWNRQNAYNSPIAQMQRLRQAGLNPNLAYGQLSSGEAGSLESVGADATVQAPEFENPFANAPQNVQSAIAAKQSAEMHAEELEQQRLKNIHQDLLNKRQKHDNDRAGVIDTQNDEAHDKTMRNLDEAFANMQKQGLILTEQGSQEKIKTAIAEYRKQIDEKLADNELAISDENRKYAVNLNTMIALQMATEKAKKEGIDLDNDIKRIQKDIMENTKDMEIIAKRMSLVISAYTNASALGKKQMLDKALGFDVKFDKDGNPILSGSAYLVDKDGKHLNKNTQKWLDGMLKKMRDAPGDVTESDILKYAVEIGLLLAK